MCTDISICFNAIWRNVHELKNGTTGLPRPFFVVPNDCLIALLARPTGSQVAESRSSHI
jgi:hypothetical protein